MSQSKKPRRLSAHQLSTILTDHLVETGGRPEFGLICGKHSPQPGAFSGQAPATFVGKFVQLAFPTGLESPPHERMWVRVERLYEGDTDDQLEGTLDNTPRFTKAWTYRSTLAFKVSEIIKVLDPESDVERYS